MTLNFILVTESTVINLTIVMYATFVWTSDFWEITSADLTPDTINAVFAWR